MGMEALGRQFDIVTAAASVSLKEASGVTFICTAVTAAETFTLNSQPSSGGAATPCAAIRRYYTRTAHDGSVPWTDSGDVASVNNVVVAAGSEVAFYVDAADLPAGASYVEVVATGGGTGSAIAVLTGLLQQQNPKLLAAPKI